MTTPGRDATKAEWRDWARRERAAIDFESISAAITDALAGWLPEGGRVLLYHALADEPDLARLADGYSCFVTRLGEDGVLSIHPYESDTERHSLGFRQPVADAPTVDPATLDVLLVPGLAFDRSGGRLGRGGGHYDRLLTTIAPGPTIVGVTPSALVVDELPRESHDRAVSFVATEQGVASVPPMADPLEAARRWAAHDPDPETSAELQRLVEAGDHEAVDRLMGTPLTFGTAGIRGEVGPGPSRMNRAVVIRTTAGITDYLNGRGDAGGLIVVGHDARPDSARFARDTVGVLVAARFEVRVFADHQPTPLVAFTGLRMGAVMTIVVTASHNPRSDNGYKVYDSNGAQIVPPVDRQIAVAIERVGPADEVDREAGGVEIGEDAVAAYRDAVLGFRGEMEVGTVPLVYTPLHGVGGSLFTDVLASGGHDRVVPVPQQFTPDGSFPTTPFPNPEEKGALDLAEMLAAEHSIDVVLANDPDADRLAVSLGVAAGYRRLTGNEIGALLADFVLERTSGDDRLVVNSVVSSPMLAAIARRHGAAHATTLTGFKWICNAALDLEETGKRFVFGYEEALGYTVGPVVRDKDGIGAGLWFADLVATCRAAGETVLERLARLFVEDGLWVSTQESVRREGPDGMVAIAEAMDRADSFVPEMLAGRRVVAVTDYAIGAEARPRWLPATSLVEFSLDDGSRVLVRPSGTEPKLKVYADVVAPVTSTDAVDGARAAAVEVARSATSELIEALAIR